MIENGTAHPVWLLETMHTDDVEAGTPATWLGRGGEVFPATIVSISRSPDSRWPVHDIRSREEGNGSERRFSVSWTVDAKNPYGTILPACGSMRLYVGRRLDPVEDAEDIAYLFAIPEQANISATDNDRRNFEN